MERNEIIVSFPLENLSIGSLELSQRKSLADSAIIQKVAALCQWWYSHNEHLEFGTSGSTGKPKTVRFNRSSILSSISMTKIALNLVPGQEALLAIDPDFVGGKMMILRSLAIGMNLTCVAASSDPLKNFKELNFDFAAFVPVQLETMLSLPERIDQLEKIDKIIIGGAPLSASLKTKASSLSNKIFLTFGMTETLSHIALMDLKSKHQVFKGLSGVHFSVDDRGCLIIHAPTIQEKPFVTNDLVNLFNAQEFQWLGRWDNAINSGGIKLFPESLEERIEPVLKQFEWITAFFFCPVDDDRLGQMLTLIIIGHDEPDINKLKLLLSESSTILSPYERPREIYWCSKVILNQGGKADRRQTFNQSKKVWTKQ